MIKTPIIALSFCLLTGCDDSHKKATGDSGANEADRQSAEMPSKEAPMMLKDVFRDRERLLGKIVNVVACLSTHFEGPWICEHPDAPFMNAMGLEIPDGCKLISKNGTSELNWRENDKGYPVVIVGTLRMREKRSEADPEVRLYIVVGSAREISIDDPIWRNYAQQFKTEGEQGAAVQPPPAPTQK